MKAKKVMAVMTAAVMAAGLTACGSSSGSGDGAGSSGGSGGSGKYVIGICQQMEHPSLDDATAGFRDATPKVWHPIL